MRSTFFTLVFIISGALLAQTPELSSYQKKTMNTERFARPVNTGVNHTLLILGSAWPVSPEFGDEIAVYDSKDNMVASVAWVPEQEGHAGLAIWGDDETTLEKEGMSTGEVFKIILFDKSEDMMTDVKVNRWERGDNIFIKDGVSVVGSVETTDEIAQEMELFQNVPNPVMDITSISFYLPEDANVRLTVSNTLGQEIMTLSDSSFTKGMHSVDMDATSLTTGVYFYKLVANKTSLTKQLTLVR